MPIRVIEPPEPIVTSDEIPGGNSGDAVVEAMIAAVTGEIDGPDGWLGRCLGAQTLELRLDCWPHSPFRLPCPPVINVEGISYFDVDDVEQAISDDVWDVTAGMLWFRSSWSAPTLATSPVPVKVMYRAGYDGNDIDSGGTGAVPAQVKQAIILSVQHMRSLSKDDLFLKADEVDGIGRKEWTVSEQAGNIIRDTSERLLKGLRVYS